METLISAHQIPETAHFPEVSTWDELLSAVGTLRENKHDYSTLVIDTLNGAERLCHEHVCKRDYNGEWGKQGFTSYQQGFEVSLADWRELLQELDYLRSERKMSVLCLCHTKVCPFKNPEGADYDRYAPDMHQKTWSLSHKWSDAVLFVNFETFVNESDSSKKGKATSSQARIMYTERHAAYDAKNRFGLPNEINMGDSGLAAWGNFAEALKTSRNGSE